VNDKTLDLLETLIGPFNAKPSETMSPDHFLERAYTIHLYNKYVASFITQKHGRRRPNKQPPGPIPVLFVGAKLDKEIVDALSHSDDNYKFYSLVVSGDMVRSRTDFAESSRVTLLSYEHLCSFENDFFSYSFSIHSIYDVEPSQLALICAKTRHQRLRCIAFLTPRAYLGLPETNVFGTSFVYQSSAFGYFPKLLMTRSSYSVTYINNPTVHRALSLFGTSFVPSLEDGLNLFSFLRLNTIDGHDRLCAFDVECLPYDESFIHNIPYKDKLVSLTLNGLTTTHEASILRDISLYAFKNASVKNFVESLAAYYSTRCRTSNQEPDDDYSRVLLAGMLWGAKQRHQLGQIYASVMDEIKGLPIPDKQITYYGALSSFIKSFFPALFGRKDRAQAMIDSMVTHGDYSSENHASVANAIFSAANGVLERRLIVSPCHPLSIDQSYLSFPPEPTDDPFSKINKKHALRVLQAYGLHNPICPSYPLNFTSVSRRIADSALRPSFVYTVPRDCRLIMPNGTCRMVPSTHPGAFPLPERDDDNASETSESDDAFYEAQAAIDVVEDEFEAANPGCFTKLADATVLLRMLTAMHSTFDILCDAYDAQLTAPSSTTSTACNTPPEPTLERDFPLEARYLAIDILHDLLLDVEFKRHSAPSESSTPPLTIEPVSTPHAPQPFETPQPTISVALDSYSATLMPRDTPNTLPNERVVHVNQDPNLTRLNNCAPKPAPPSLNFNAPHTLTPLADAIASFDGTKRTMAQFISGHLRPYIYRGDPSCQSTIKVAYNEFLKNLIYASGEDVEISNKDKAIFEEMSIAKNQLQLLTAPPVEIIHGVFGCGKTSYFAANFRPGVDAYTVPFKGVCGATKSDLKEVFGDVPMIVETFITFYDHLQAFNGTLYIDEFPSFSPGYLYHLILNTSASKVILMGDTAQTSYHSEHFLPLLDVRHFALPFTVYDINTTYRIGGPAFDLVNSLNGNRYYSDSTNITKISIVFAVPKAVELLLVQSRAGSAKYRDMHVTKTWKSCQGLTSASAAVLVDKHADATFTAFLEPTTVAFSRAKNDLYIVIKDVPWETSRFRAYLDLHSVAYDYQTGFAECTKPVFHTTGGNVKPTGPLSTLTNPLNKPSSRSVTTSTLLARCRI
jgi:hypothetical protein